MTVLELYLLSLKGWWGPTSHCCSKFPVKFLQQSSSLHCFRLLLFAQQAERVFYSSFLSNKVMCTEFIGQYTHSHIPILHISNSYDTNIDYMLIVLWKIYLKKCKVKTKKSSESIACLILILIKIGKWLGRLYIFSSFRFTDLGLLITSLYFLKTSLLCFHKNRISLYVEECSQLWLHTESTGEP